MKRGEEFRGSLVKEEAKRCIYSSGKFGDEFGLEKTSLPVPGSWRVAEASGSLAMISCHGFCEVWAEVEASG